MRFLLKFMSLITIIGLLFVTGTVAYHNMEGWSYTDSFYYTGVTLLTIGYGDFVPTHSFSKIFTVFFGMAGVGMMLLFMTIVFQELYQRQEKLRLHAEKRVRHIANRVIRHHSKKVSRFRRRLLKGSE